jgi:predicted metalloprotease with PDZ domain
MKNTIRLCGLLAALACAATGASAAGPRRYELKFERPNTHLMDVTIHADGLNGKSVEFAMPDWAPGSYYIMNYSAEIQGFQAADADNKPLPWRKTDGQTWQIDLGGASAVTVQYQVYGNTLANNLAQYNDQHAFFGGPAVWMYQVDGKELPIVLSVAPPEGWKIATGMERTGTNQFRAENYDWFADAPMEISNFAESSFDVSGTTYHVIVHDVEGQKPAVQFAADLQRTVAATVPMFASVTGTLQPAPFKEYWFLFHVWPKTGGGLEHLNSTQIDFSTDWDDMGPAGGAYGNRYDLKLYVTAHEFFHAWNVKRLRPLPLGPFDYSREVHTPSLWISEGITSYYGALMLVRARIVKPDDYLKRVGQLITDFESEPGRKERSIEDTSWDTWYRTLKTENNLDNTSYSYYDGGQITGHLLDFAIRHATDNHKSLDDWMRLLYLRYALPKPGFQPQDAIQAASELAGADLSEFFHKYISGKEPLPYEQYFGYAGIEVKKTMDNSKPWLGISTQKDDDERPKITNVIPNSPADAAGLSRGDLLVAIDGRAVTVGGVSDAVGAHKPGDNIRIAVFREGRLREFQATLCGNPHFAYELKPMEKMSQQQKKIYQGWLGLE